MAHDRCAPHGSHWARHRGRSGIGNAVVDGRRDEAVAHGERGGGRFDRAGCAQRVAVHRLGGTHRQTVGVLAEDLANGRRLGGSLASVPVP